MNPWVMLPLLLSMRYLDFEDATTIYWLRIAFVVSTVICIGYLQFLKQKIATMTFNKDVKYPVEEPGKPKQMLNALEYDQHEAGKLQTQQLIGLVIILVMHYYWNFVQPLFFQAVTGPVNLATHQLSKIHIWGQSATGKLERPFKADNPFADLMQQYQDATAEPQPAVSAKDQRKAIATKRSKKVD